MKEIQEGEGKRRRVENVEGRREKDYWAVSGRTWMESEGSEKA